MPWRKLENGGQAEAYSWKGHHTGQVPVAATVQKKKKRREK